MISVVLTFGELADEEKDTRTVRFSAPPWAWSCFDERLNAETTELLRILDACKLKKKSSL